MKKLIPLLLLLATVFVSSCSKERRCQCVNVNNADEILYVTADNGFRCSKIKKLGVERLVEGQLVRDMEDVTCTEAKR